MISEKKIFTIIQSSLDELYDASFIDTKILVSSETPLFGKDSNLDSMSFVALMTDIEDKFSKIIKKDIFIVLLDVEERFPGSQTLTAGMLVNYLFSLNNE